MNENLIRERIPIPEPSFPRELFRYLTNARRFLQRFGCPKRSTIGAFYLGTLDKDWRDYADFHINTIGCGFCIANLEDIKTENEKKQDTQLQARIMESTIGFFQKS